MGAITDPRWKKPTAHQLREQRDRLVNACDRLESAHREAMELMQRLLNELEDYIGEPGCTCIQEGEVFGDPPPCTCCQVRAHLARHGEQR